MLPALLSAKREVTYNTTKAMYPNEAKALEQLVESYYEKALENILYTVGNAARHHANLTNSTIIKQNPFFERFVEDYGYNIFITAVSLGHQVKAGTADKRFQNEIIATMELVNKKMMNDAISSFSSQKIAECFSAGAKVAADLGLEAGEQIYNQGFIAIKK